MFCSCAIGCCAMMTLEKVNLDKFKTEIIMLKVTKIRNCCFFITHFTQKDFLDLLPSAGVMGRNRKASSVCSRGS